MRTKIKASDLAQEPTEVLAFRLPASTAAELKKIAARENMGWSELARRVMKRFVEINAEVK